MDDPHRPSHEGRSRMYKANARDQHEMRRKRREDEVQIRKNHREDRFERNRRVTVERSLSQEETSEMLKTVVDGLHSMNETMIFESIGKLGENVRNRVWTIQVVAKAQILNKMADLYCNRPIHLETRQLIAQTFLILGGNLDLIKYQSYSNDDKCIQALVLNISNYNQEESILIDTFQSISCFIIRSLTYRNLALDAAIVPELLEVSAKSMSILLHRSLMWLVSLFCEKLDKYSPHVDEVAPLLEIVATGITSSDAMVQTDAASACAALSDWPPIFECMQELKLCSMLVANLSNDKGNARPKVKCSISYIIQATGYFTEEMIEAGLLEVLKGFVNVSYMSQEVCFIISNICVEGEHTIDKLISSGVLREVARVMEAAEYRSRKEAAFVICHCCASSKRAHLEYVIELGMLAAFTDLLTCMDVSLVSYVRILSILIIEIKKFRHFFLVGFCWTAPSLSCVLFSLPKDGQFFHHFLFRFYPDDDEIATSTSDYQTHSTIDSTIELLLRNTPAAPPFSF
ncbi:CRE-IMA-1 protein [Caenorhabditis remanei]|uniref:CRE-IMA-1 protein n=1 Tax=Caenorhabditis remanei TaxID=31234 RepID=E3NKQ9_CAERE|nr:CRE-IMA-1 protein [Caenorhabditis remanei]